MKQIKVLAIVNAIFGYDGISNVVKNYYIYRNKELVSMDILTINEVPEQFEKNIIANENKHYILESRNYNPIKYLIKLKKIIKNNKYDIVHIHGNSATMVLELLAAKMAGCKVRVAHSHNTKCNHPIINALLMPVFSRLYTHCCACSVEAGKFLFGEHDFFVVKNGISMPKYEFSMKTRDKIRRECGIGEQFVIGHVGRFSYQKNQEFLIKILGEILKYDIDVLLLLIGEGETEEEIKRLAEEYEVSQQVIFYGTSDEVGEMFQAMDCFVFPSRFEGLGIVAIEAQASGLNCVVSDNVPKLVDVNNDTRFLSLDASLDDWIRNIIEVRRTADEREKAKAGMKKKMQDAGFDIVQNCKDMYEIYVDMIG